MENSLEIARFGYREQARSLIEFGESDPATRSTLSNRHVAEIVKDQERRITLLETQVAMLRDLLNAAKAHVRPGLPLMNLIDDALAASPAAKEPE